ncbi:MAG: DUF2851 family protein [Bacteroidetes bacterium]|jgi:hypothetical protein|nr:DUF2851 family protein [Bacteroidota bacterium]MBT4402138.1 DUF2851 family protein [Bacteroidota bacterium]MBT4409767.1 DUF2851 family protein [Bacteroidota bacterium]MBT5425665.1 DUF2851 family protein [Bacteroidota bacterium]MBT7093709.1 DUF2851 family protein [Bacteroidota bacterium]
MTEEFLHYIWRYGLYRQKSLSTSEGFDVTVIKAGWLNRDSGPDFLNARIRIGKAEWIGHVEIHLKASDWYQHQHQHDPHYDQVILHVVYQLDKAVYTTGGSIIPAIELEVDECYFDTYMAMVNNISPIPCGSAWKSIPTIHVETALVAMGVNRLQSKIESMSAGLEENRGGWKNLSLRVLFRGFGFGKNHENFEILARSIDHQILEKNLENLFQLECLLFGQAGMIPEQNPDPYALAISKEYAYMREKYHLKKPTDYNWNRKRTRPGNQPAVRIAQLAAWLYNRHDYFELLLSPGSQSSGLNFDATISSYWSRHIDFGRKAKKPNTSIGHIANGLLQINVVLPFTAFYRQQHGEEEAIRDWLEQLEQIPPEDNSILRNWKEAGFRIPNAFYSQTFLYLYKEFCVNRRCLQCSLGRLTIRE